MRRLPAQSLACVQLQVLQVLLLGCEGEGERGSGSWKFIPYRVTVSKCCHWVLLNFFQSHRADSVCPEDAIDLNTA